MKIRKAKSEDWKLIQKLNNEVFLNDEKSDEDLDMNWPFSEEGIEYYKSLCDGSWGNCLIAEISNEPAGYIAIGVKDFGYRNGKHVEIENIGVSPKYRSQGVGEN